jgi:hypothetical protein
VRRWWGGLPSELSELCDAATPSPRVAVSSPPAAPVPRRALQPGSDPEVIVPVFVPGRGRRRKSELGQVYIQFRPKRTVPAAPTKFQSGPIYSARKRPGTTQSHRNERGLRSFPFFVFFLFASFDCASRACILNLLFPISILMKW